MHRRLASLVLVAVLAACSSEAPTAPAAAQRSRGSSGSSGSTTVMQVAGTWAGTTVNTSSAGDSTQWSLTLRQNGDRLEGGLVRIVYVNGQSFLGVSAIKRGSVSGHSIVLELDRGEGAEVAPTFFGTVDDAGATMVGSHSRYAESVTLVRR